MSSESEFAEEEVSVSLLLGSLVLHVSGLEVVLELEESSLSGLSVVHDVFSDGGSELEVVLNHESGGEQVVVVNVLDKRLHAGFTLNFLGVHGAGNTLGASLNSTNEGVGEFLVL
jgi:hypothetical protein|tara:strand:- start:267 stop:611 length:345 start_codon:yes stop_codon:yes gene_type:complete